MTSFDSHVLDWVKMAKLPRGEKADLLQRSLKCIEGHKHVQIGVSVQQDTEQEIAVYLDQVAAAIEKYGEYALDEEEDKPAAAADRDADAAADGDDTIDDAEHEDALRAQSRGRRKTVSAEALNMEDVMDYTPPQHDKPDDEMQWGNRVLGAHYLFEHLDSSELATLVSAFEVIEADEGEELLAEGAQGDTLYVVRHGSIDVTQADAQREVTTEGIVGDEQVMYNADAQFTLTAGADTTLWTLTHSTYRAFMTKASVTKRGKYEEFLSNIEFLSGLTRQQRLQIADGLKTKEFVDGETIITYGEEGTHFHIIVSGTVKVTGRKGDSADSEPVEVCTFGEGDCVGELEFINKHKTCADVTAAGAVKTATMSRRHFETVLGSIEQVLRGRYQENEKFAYYREKNLE